MGDRMTVIPFDQLIMWSLEEYDKNKTIFGIPARKFYKSTGTSRDLFGKTLETPIGSAAGPHTQLAQNIIASYLTGCRFFELKTVQIIDGEDLPVSKPCIWAEDEGYNVEWSTELSVPQAFDEYVKAWFALHVLSKELSLGAESGFVFNMSLGYDLAGIRSEKIDRFIEGLKNAQETRIWKDCKKTLMDGVSNFKKIDSKFVESISPFICDIVTLSTLHGCKAEEIEAISQYLLKDKGLHTYVKFNPTLLGYEFVRDLLNKMGFDAISFDKHHFENDLQYHDAITMITRLKSFAVNVNREFGVKLTNTFPVKIKSNELPGEEMYMSGRALYPLTINLAYQLAKDFNGDLRISYSGGADYFNIDKIFETGIEPITLATTVLKPGGYTRFTQMAQFLDKLGAQSEPTRIDVEKLAVLALSAQLDNNHKKDRRTVKSRKISGKVPLLDCFIAPCLSGCPISQDVPEYIRLVGEGRYIEALEQIIIKNPMPFTTGTLCNHRCMDKCTRIDYDESVQIRSMKLLAARKGFDGAIQKIKSPMIQDEPKVAIIGAGPAGLSAGYFLGQQGFHATIFDKKDKIGGIIEHVAPGFRILQEEVNKDLELVKKMGVKFRLNIDPNFSLEALKNEGFKYIVIAIGAWKIGTLKLKATDTLLLNVLEFLEAYKKAPETLKLGKNVAIIGAGNSAMDAARAAKRILGVENVYIIYRRTKQYMPAEREEVALALAEGVIFKELLTPISLLNGCLKCQQMVLGTPDIKGRRSPIINAGQFEVIRVDSLISAVGEKVEIELLTTNGIEVDSLGRVKVDPKTNETNISNVFIGGDALRGPATIVEGIADGTKVAHAIIAREKGVDVSLNTKVNFDREKQIQEIIDKKGVLQNAQVEQVAQVAQDVDLEHNLCVEHNLCFKQDLSLEHNRCLECNTVCEICTEVCPNRANIAIQVKTGSGNTGRQIVHLDGMCNECGNCETFCPYESAPYKEKFTLYWSEEDFKAGTQAGFVLMNQQEALFKVRIGEMTQEVQFEQSGKCNPMIQKEIADLIWSIYQEHHYIFI